MKQNRKKIRFFIVSLVCVGMVVALLQQGKGTIEVMKQQTRQEQQQRKQCRLLLEQAERFAQSYDYEKALALLTKIQRQTKGKPEERMVCQIRQTYQQEQKKLIVYHGIVQHIFFHSLIVDPKQAFDGSRMQNGFNAWMVTEREFRSILKRLYQKGYVLIGVHDWIYKEKKNGRWILKQKPIRLPKGKKPVILSQDDVNYYSYMNGHGFATCLCLDAKNRVVCKLRREGTEEMKQAYDVVPIVDQFVEAHPDFSYHGAKGMIAVTGYEGVLGYRTNHKKAQKEKKQVKQLVHILRKTGWEFASHSYGHRHMATCSLHEFQKDCVKWEKEVKPLVGKTDLYIYPYGEEVDPTSKKFSILKKMGFRYFFGVCAKPWMQLHTDYLRMTRRNIDGYTMFFHPERLQDLFFTKQVWDKRRPSLRSFSL